MRTVKDAYNLPWIDETLERLKGSCVFSSLKSRRFRAYHGSRMYLSTLHKFENRDVLENVPEEDIGS